MNFYEHHIGDWDSATAHLSLLEEAVYSRLVRIYYRSEKPIPADLKQAARLVRAQSKPEREAVQVVLEEFFVLGADGWHNKRCDAEIVRYREKCEKASRSADARWKRTTTHTEGNADAMRTHTEGNADGMLSSPQTPDTIHQEKGDTPQTPLPPDGGRHRFVPPSVQDVQEFAAAHGLELDAAAFCDFYASKGWKVGTAPMRDWRAAARNWVRRDGVAKKRNGAAPHTREEWEAWGVAKGLQAKRGESLNAYVARLQAAYEVAAP